MKVSSSSGNISLTSSCSGGAVSVSDEGKTDGLHYAADFNHLHFEVPFEKLPSVMEELEKTCVFDAEELFHESFRYVGKTELKRDLWLRRRRNLTKKKNEAYWMLGETWDVNFHYCARVKEVAGEKAIQARLVALGFSDDLEGYQLTTEYRFFRIHGQSSEFGVVNIDETALGIMLSFKPDSKLHYDTVMSRCGKLLEVSKSKLMAAMERRPYSAHLCGFRADALMCELSEDDCTSAEEDWNQRLQEEMAKPFVAPDITAKFSDDPESFTAKARKILRGEKL